MPPHGAPACGRIPSDWWSAEAARRTLPADSTRAQPSMRPHTLRHDAWGRGYLVKRVPGGTGLDLARNAIEAGCEESIRFQYGTDIRHLVSGDRVSRVEIPSRSPVLLYICSRPQFITDSDRIALYPTQSCLTSVISTQNVCCSIPSQLSFSADTSTPAKAAPVQRHPGVCHGFRRDPGVACLAQLSPHSNRLAEQGRLYPPIVRSRSGYVFRPHKS